METAPLHVDDKELRGLCKSRRRVHCGLGSSLGIRRTFACSWCRRCDKVWEGSLNPKPETLNPEP